MPKRYKIYNSRPEETMHESHERPMYPEEVEEIEKLRACLLSAHDLARLLEWRVTHLPSNSLDKITCDRVCKVLHKHSEKAGGANYTPTNEGDKR